MNGALTIHRHLEVAVVLLGIGCASGLSLAAQQPAGCVLQFQDHYRCDREAFQAKLAAAHTIRVSVARMELFAAQQMSRLVTDLGKTETTQGARPDLVFELSAIDRTGRIDFGPNDYALATLSVYEPVGTNKRKTIWVETFDGQEDRPWPGTVVDLIRQFQRNALKH